MVVLRLIPLFICLFFISPSVTNAQIFTGHSMSLYSGITGVRMNPASFVGGRLASDVQIIGFGTSLENDYAGVNFQDLFRGTSNFSFDQNLDKLSSFNNNALLELDLSLGSTSFRIGDKNSIGFMARFRMLASATGVDGNYLDGNLEGFGTQDSYTFDMDNLNGTVHGFFEVGINYSRMIFRDNTKSLQLGVTAKYLAGLGGGFVNSTNLSGEHDASSKELTTLGSLSYGNALNFDLENLSLGTTQGTVGLDFGAIFEINPFQQLKLEDFRGEQIYRLRVGLSVTDIGSITYKESEETLHDMNNVVDTEEYDELNFVDALDEFYPSTSSNIDRKVNLPTALHFFIDYAFTERWFLGFQGRFSANDNQAFNQNIQSQTLAIIPRYEYGRIGLMSPLSIREFDQNLNWGFGARLGPFSIGSSTIFSNLLSSSSQSVDVFVAFKSSMYRFKEKRKKKK